MATDYSLTGSGNVENVSVKLPSEGELFLRPSGEGANRLSVIQGGNVVDLGFQYPTDWQGKTIGQFQNEQTSKALSSLGLSGVPVVNEADFQSYIKSKGLGQQTISDLNQFVSQFKGASIFGGQSVTRTPNTGSEFYDSSNPAAPNFAKAIPGYGTSPATDQSLAGKGNYNLGDPVFMQNALAQTYNKRGDLQQLFNPDGSVKNPTDPRVKGISSLKDWATQYGYKEEPNLAGFRKDPIPETTGTITADSMTGEQKPIKVSVPGGSSSANAIVSSSQAVSKSINDYLKESTPPETATSKRYNAILGEVEGLLPELAGKSAYQLEQEKAAGLPQIKAQLADLNAQILSRTAEYNKLYTDIEGRPITMNSIIGSQAQIQKMQAADIGLLQARALGLQGQIQAAQDTANRAVDLKFSAITDELNVRLQQLDLISGQLNKEETRYAQALEMYYNDQIKQAELKREDAKYAFQLALEYGVTAPLFENGGIIYNTQTLEAVYENVGGEIRRLSDGRAFSTEQEFFRDARITNWNQLQSITELQQLKTEKDNNQALVADLAAKYPDAGINLADGLAVAQSKLSNSRIYQEQVRPPQYAGGGSGGDRVTVVDDSGNVVSPDDPEYFIKLLQSSKGGKSVDVETAKSLTKAFNVVGQIEDLQDAISGEVTGPLTSIIRSNNPYDVKASLIKAQLSAIVPNLARGVFGEVGVLTDNDIALYSKTLPNLQNTEEIRNLIMGATVRTVQRSIENQLEVMASLGRDVSGLENKYVSIKSQADKLLTISDSGSQENEPDQGWWSKATNWLFGD